MKTKALAYAYASSPDAARYGFPKTGCYLVETQVGSNPAKSLAGYATKAEAMAHLNRIDLPLNRYSLSTL